jgi:hypothetical protein
MLMSSLIPVLIIAPTWISAFPDANANNQPIPQWSQYTPQTCDPVNDPSTCKPG